jgi:hypothetical protein
MVPARKFTVEQIVARLSEMKRLQGQGCRIRAACKRPGISHQTFYPGAMESSPDDFGMNTRKSPTRRPLRLIYMQRCSAILCSTGPQVNGPTGKPIRGCS